MLACIPAILGVLWQAGAARTIEPTEVQVAPGPDAIRMAESTALGHRAAFPYRDPRIRLTLELDYGEHVPGLRTRFAVDVVNSSRDTLFVPPGRWAGVSAQVGSGYAPVPVRWEGDSSHWVWRFCPGDTIRDRGWLAMDFFEARKHRLHARFFHAIGDSVHVIQAAEDFAIFERKVELARTMERWGMQKRIADSTALGLRAPFPYRDERLRIEICLLDTVLTDTRGTTLWLTVTNLSPDSLWVDSNVWWPGLAVEEGSGYRRLPMDWEMLLEWNAPWQWPPGHAIVRQGHWSGDDLPYGIQRIHGCYRHAVSESFVEVTVCKEDWNWERLKTLEPCWPE